MKLQNPLAPTYLLGGNIGMHIVLALNASLLAIEAYKNDKKFVFMS
jgi:hypothetical protein